MIVSRRKGPFGPINYWVLSAAHLNIKLLINNSYSLLRTKCPQSVLYTTNYSHYYDYCYNN